MLLKSNLAASACFVALLAQGATAAPRPSHPPGPADRARATVERMTDAERTVLTHGIMPLPVGPNPPVAPPDAVPGAGYVAGIPRLGVPSLRETDASLGVAYVFGIRKDGATALPSGLAMASTWNPDLIRKGGAMIGTEARAKGFNVMLAGGANLIREPRNGRAFEYLSEDPLLTGVLAGSAIAGIQSSGVISTIKHFALNAQETGRKFVDVKIAEPAARESELLAFQIGIEIGRPGSVMCAYNRVNGAPACGSDWLLNQVLKRDWRYPGFVMSDWGAVGSLALGQGGLDQQSGEQLDPQVFFGAPLAKAAAGDPQWRARLDDMNRRILTSVYALGLDQAGPAPNVDPQANAGVAQEVAAQGIVLLRNRDGLLPLAAQARRIAVIGGYADAGVMSGAGSSQVQGPGGPAVRIPLGGEGPFSPFLAQAYHRSVPLAAIRASAPGADVRYRDGRSVSEAVAQARKADVVVVFATKWSSEGFDQADLSLPDGQDELIAAVAAANPRTIVVLETGNPVDMPWLSKTGAVLEAWFPGARGGEAIADVLFGRVNPSGRLPVTFPAQVSQLPRPAVDGFDTLEPNFTGEPPTPDATLRADYDIEGSDVGYRWFARQALQPLFPFGFGLSYTSFETSGLTVSGLSARLSVRNTGARQGADVAQLYLVSRNGKASRRLVGFQRVDLAPGESRAVDLTIDPRLLADWTPEGWTIAPGDYAFAVGSDAAHLGPVSTVRLAARRWKD